MTEDSAKINKSVLFSGVVNTLLLTTLLGLCSLPASAAGAADSSGLPLPPDIPPPVEDGAPMDQDVRIYHEDKKTIYEYRVNGELFLIKVVPEIGPTYFLTDADGDGVVDEQTQGPTSGMKIHQWKLFSW
ncbi:MAG TPA: DUF2782 domain-containing protein [Crenotrichaceae bacterium]|nr:DUF2782 domain-containing protein [Crenotrichaceae bacterium]